IGIIIFAILLIAVVNAILLGRKSLSKEKIAVDRTLARKYAEELSILVRHKTIALKDTSNEPLFVEMQKDMEKLFPLVHQNLVKHFFPGGSMLFHWKGKSNENPLVLMAHQDVVPASIEQWSVDPFAGVVTDTEIIGRGSFDTKCTLYAFFRAVEELLETGYVPETDVYLSSSSDEEISGVGAATIVEFLKSQDIKPGLVLDEGGAIVTGALPSVSAPLALIGVIEKGYVNFKLTAKSSGGHSSTPPKNTPIARLAALINDIEKNFPLKTKMIPEVKQLFATAAPAMSFPYRLLFGNMWLFKGLTTWLLPKINPYGRALFSTTIAFTMMEGSKAENVIPSEAYVIANLRTHPIQGIASSHEAISKLAKKYNVECEILEGREATPMVNTQGKAYRYLVNQIQSNFPDVLISPYVILGGTDARFYQEICDSALRFSPIRVSNEDLKKMHGIDESLKIDALAEAVIFFSSLIQGYDGLRK
ncbi:MAG: M20/M25/M40 family metallo-hydrolase, partial [Bacilli bacterium]|nr:M20/M25/M40 family metallo-hydrolase [Bacilli bacterium]